MNYKMKYFQKDLNLQDFSTFVLGADIGGTSTNLCIAGVKELKPVLLYSLNFKSKKINSLTLAFNQILNYSKEKYNINVKSVCIGAAGIISQDENSARLTNVKWDINLNELKKQTSIEWISIINDFQAIGFGINLLNSKNSLDISVVKRGNIKSKHATKAIIGAGTGLGKSILVFDKTFDAYVPIPSEGGHADFPPQDDFEMSLVKFIKRLRQISQPLTYEEILSGRGLESIYFFLRNSGNYKESVYTQEVDSAEEKAPLISKYKTVDETCKNTFSFFSKFFARCAKNYVLDTFASGGLYIAGGIASKNKEIFTTDKFIQEFENAYRRSDLLKNITISVITNYDISLYGACFAAVHFLKNKGVL